MPVLTRLASHARTRYYRRRLRNVSFAPTSHVRGRLRVTGGGRVEVGHGVFFDDAVGPTSIHVEAGATVRLGAGCYVNGLTITAAADVTIGPGCLLGDAVITSTNHHSVAADRTSSAARPRIAPVVIEENVWIGGRVVVLPGVTIGRDAVVAIASVVHEDVPAGAIVSSHHQRVIGVVPGRPTP